MNIKNYTSEVSIDRSITYIEHCLVSVGASHIAKAYRDGNVSGIIFRLDIPGQGSANFRLPARWEKVFQKMWKQVKKPRKDTEARVRDQAQRTAWKLLYDQIAVQTSNVLIEQQEAIEAFMPYLYDGKRDMTIYEIAKQNGFKQLVPHED